jgi:hypothetical protein
MASILDRYGIKEVADVTFYEITEQGDRGNPVLYLDTLKVSTIEQTSEQSDARGGKGNPKLITWDYGKDITVTLEDALFSAKSLAIMFGDGTVNKSTVGGNTITRTVMVRLDKDGLLPDYITADVAVKDSNNKLKGSERKKVYLKNTPASLPNDSVSLAESKLLITEIVSEDGLTETKVTSNNVSAFKGGASEKVFITYIATATTREIVVSADTFPGTYYVTGDTYARSDVTGDDQFFQFIIPKAKVTTENTITLEAEGDPSVFSMNLTVLRPEDGDMMKLVQYDLTGDTPTAPSSLDD